MPKHRAVALIPHPIVANLPLHWGVRTLNVAKQCALFTRRVAAPLRMGGQTFAHGRPLCYGTAPRFVVAEMATVVAPMEPVDVTIQSAVARFVP